MDFWDKTLKTKRVYNYIVGKALDEGKKLDPLKTAELVYYSHAWYLGYESKPLLREPVEAQKYGATIPSISKSLKFHGPDSQWAPLVKDELKYGLLLIHGLLDKIPAKAYVSTDSLTEKEKNVIDMVWNAYKKYDAKLLMKMANAKGSPWSQVWRGLNRVHNTVIPNSLIKSYYKEQIAAAQS
jgi:uncharacterized phage-associated protein